MARARPSCPTEVCTTYLVMREPCLIKRKSKKPRPCARHSSRVFRVGFDNPETDGFPKAAMQNQDPRGSFELETGALSVCLFYFVLSHYIADGRGFGSIWRAVLFGLARNQLLVASNVRYQRRDASPVSPPGFRSQAATISPIYQFRTLHTSCEIGHPAITL